MKNSKFVKHIEKNKNKLIEMIKILYNHHENNIYLSLQEMDDDQPNECYFDILTNKKSLDYKAAKDIRGSLHIVGDQYLDCIFIDIDAKINVFEKAIEDTDSVVYSAYINCDYDLNMNDMGVSVKALEDMNRIMKKPIELIFHNDKKGEIEIQIGEGVCSIKKWTIISEGFDDPKNEYLITELCKVMFICSDVTNYYDVDIIVSAIERQDYQLLLDIKNVLNIIII